MARLGASFALAAILLARPAAAAPDRGGIGLGLAYDSPQAVEVAESPAADAAAPRTSVRLAWGLQDAETAGTPDWSEADRALDRLAESGGEVTLVLAAVHPIHAPDGALPSPANDPALQSWLAFVREAVQRYGERVATVQLGERLSAADLDAVAGLALVLKQSALAVRAEARAQRIPLLVGLPALAASAADLRQSFWESDLAAYVDVLTLALDPSADSRSQLDAVEATIAKSLEHPPAMRVRVAIAPDATWAGAELALEALDAGVEAAFIAAGARAPEGLVEWVAGTERLLARDHLPAPRGSARLEASGGGTPPGRVLGRFFGEEAFTTLVPYTTGGPADGWKPSSSRLVLDALAVSEARIVDPRTGEERRVSPLPARSGQVAFALFEADSPRVVVYTLGLDPDVVAAPEQLEVASSRSLTAEEIIARYQEVQREQDQRFERMLARGVADFHYRLAEGGSTVDVTIESQYFLESGGELEWEQLEYRINGSRVDWKNFPELPLIQPEKVLTLPLDLTLDRRYVYRLQGEERVAGRPAWVLAFEPAEPDSPLALYRGRVWIDQERFVRLRAALVQSDLDPPVISNEETDAYTEQLGPDGKPYWLLTEIEGQQVWNVAGRSLVVQRELRFSDFRINPQPEEFEARQEQAYASRNTMLRDTSRGYRYLERSAEGERTVKEELVTRRLFAAGGLFHDGARDEVLPLAGVDWFDYDLFDRNVQLNALFAGVFAMVNVSKPDLAGGRMDLTLDATLSALAGDDRIFVAGDEQDAERIEVLPEHLALRAGVPLGAFFKLNAIAGADWRSYARSEEQEDALAAHAASSGQQLLYRLPRDHATFSLGLEASFHRRGLSVVAEAEQARRTSWESWGLVDAATGELGRLDPATGTFVVTGGDPVEQSYTRWRATVFRDWFLPMFQKLRGELTWLDGEDLDRFSRHQFSYFGSDRLNGFSGSGVRFDHGGIARAGYSFNAFGAVRLDANLDWARVRDRSTGEGFQSFGGAGVNANFPAPWKTVVNASYGRALVSDIPELEGDDEFLLLILKLF